MTPTPPPFTQARWSLADLFPSAGGPEIESAFTNLTAMVADFEKIRPQLAPDISQQDFLDCIHKLEAITLLATRLGYFPSLWFAEDTQNQASQSLMARIEQFTTELSNRLLFFTLWWKDLPDETAQRLMASSGDYRYWLEAIRLFKPHTLSEPEEKIINIKDITGANALTTLYDTITNRYTFKITLDGEVKELTRDAIMSFARQADPDLRSRAYQELYRVYAADGPILGQIYQVLVRDWRNEQVTLRKYTSPISARNLGNDIPDEVVDTLLEVARKNAPVFQRFFRLKARLLGVERLRRYDVYAPVVNSARTYPFDDAAHMVLDSFYQFAPRFSELARRVFKDNHLDSEVRKGKMGGAFCATTGPNLTPWVLVNFQGKASDVATLAHELGHAIHSMLAEHHSVFTQHACLPLAETASTFAEMTLVDRLLSEETDEAVRRDLLFRQIDDAYSTIERQAFFALFEKQAHEMIAQDASVDELSEAYLKILQEQFGDAVEIADEFKWEWVSIPHIFRTPFYVYAYSFGQLLVLSLYKQFKAEGESFKPRYLKLLSTGGAEAPMKVLAEASIDARQASFWQGGFDVIAGLVNQLEAMTTGD
ncbi:MAG TPA: M3 family oligoendopeptidase [Anaerolineaceae bacterium]